MNRKELISRISDKSSVSKKNTGVILDELFNLIKEELSSNNSVRFLGFGRFSMDVVKPRNRFNIQLGRVSVTPQHSKIGFKPYFKLAVNNQESEDPIIKYPVFDYHFHDTGKGSFSDLLNHASNDNARKVRDNRVSRPSFSLARQSGNIVLPNQLNKGTRLELSSAKERQIFEYVGMVNNTFHGSPDYEVKTYHSIFWPFKGTKILNYNQFGGITGGVSEPILFHSLNCLKDIEPEIEILQNVTLPIQNRNYGYKPDIALIWKEKNIYIDIEIDEPYDLLSRKPIHYKGCSDSLRNAYFNQNGWFVLRFAEEQIIQHMQSVIDTVSTLLFIASLDSRFKVDNCQKSLVDCWSREEAQVMSEEGYRESYLGIDKICMPVPNNEDIEEDYCFLASFEFKRPSDDIILDRYKTEKTRLASLKSSGYTYIKIIRKIDNYEFLAFKDNVEFEYRNYLCGLKFFDEIEQVNYFVCFEEIRCFNGETNIFKRIYNTDWEKIIADAVINCNPISMSYNSSNAGLWRNVYYLTPWYLDYDRSEYSDIDKKGAIELIQGHYQFIHSTVSLELGKLEHFSGICTYRNNIRTFRSDRIVECKVFDVFKPACFLGNNAMWYLLEEEYPRMAELVFKQIPKDSEDYIPGMLNYCHTFVMQGHISSAITYYKKYDPDFYVESLSSTWKDACLADINHFIEKDIKKEYFIEVKNLLSQIWK